MELLSCFTTDLPQNLLSVSHGEAPWITPLVSSSAWCFTSQHGTLFVQFDLCLIFNCLKNAEMIYGSIKGELNDKSKETSSMYIPQQITNNREIMT